jgi:hypothetical protein
MGQSPAKLVGDDLPAYAATKNQDSLRVSHGPRPFPLEHQRAICPLNELPHVDTIESLDVQETVRS